MKNVFFEEGPEWLVNAIAYAITFVVLFVLSYLGYSFVKWDLNLFNWSELERALVVITPLIFIAWRASQS